jgi:cell division protein FtsA
VEDTCFGKRAAGNAAAQAAIETYNAPQEVAPIQEQQPKEEQHENKGGKLTFGQSLMEKVKKFFEEVE